MIFLLAIPAGVLTNLAVRGLGEDGWILLFAALDLRRQARSAPL